MRLVAAVAAVAAAGAERRAHSAKSVRLGWPLSPLVKSKPSPVPLLLLTSSSSSSTSSDAPVRPCGVNQATNREKTKKRRRRRSGKKILLARTQTIISDKIFSTTAFDAAAKKDPNKLHAYNSSLLLLLLSLLLLLLMLVLDFHFSHSFLFSPSCFTIALCLAQCGPTITALLYFIHLTIEQ